MAEINDLNTTDADNTARFPEGQNPSTVNNGARALEGMMARAFDDVINGAVTTAGTGTAYTLAPNRTIGAYYDGLTFMVKLHAVSGASPTINVSSLGAKNLIWPDGGAVAANELSANSRTLIQYDGTSFQVLFMPATRRVTETFTFTAAGSETSISGSDDDGKTLAYSTGQIRVFLNGALLDDGDYTATNGTSITGLAALAASDIFHVETYDNVAAVGSMASQNKDAVDIDGGSIDGVTLTNIPTINGVTPATAQYTTAEEAKLSGIETGADVTDATNVNAAGAVMNTDSAIQLTGWGSNLDDYEEGTFTPAYAGTTTDPTVTYSAQTGTYTKIGRVVICQINLSLSAASGGSGILQTTGLPFTAVGFDAGNGISSYRFNWTTAAPDAATIAGTTLSLHSLSTSSLANINVNHLQASSTLRMSVVYYTS
jgi:hypothetical protein